MARDSRNTPSDKKEGKKEKNAKAMKDLKAALDAKKISQEQFDAAVASAKKVQADETKAEQLRVKTEIVGRARKIIRRSVARLQAAEVRSSGNPEGNWELLKAYKAFDEQLVKITAPKPTNGETAATEPAAQ